MPLSARPLAVVTGGSTGIGFELARQFAQNGFDLVLAAQDEGHLAQAKQALEGSGAQVETVAADLATFDGTQSLYDRVKQSGRAVDALAANAGVGVGGDFIRETDLADELRIIDLNVKHVVHAVKLFGRDMVAAGRGRILVTSSIAAEMPGPREAVYAATKAFLQHFTLAVRNELKDTGVTLTALQPGPTDTHFFERADLGDTKVGQSDKMKSDPADVAKEGFEALMAGKDHVVAGGMNKLQTGLGALLPERARAEMHGAMTKPA